MPDHRRSSVPIFPVILLLALLTACPNANPPVTNRAPTANAGPDQNAAIGDTVTLDATGSTDEDGDTLAFTWIFESQPAGSAATLTAADTATPSFVPDVAGAFVLTLSVDDGLTSTSDNITIIATTTGAPNSAPALSLIADQSAPKGSVIEVPFTITDEDPDTVTVEASSSDTTLIANADLEVLGSGANRSLRVALEQEGSGSTLITLNARDVGALEGSTAFTLEVTTPFETELAKLAANDAAAGDEFGYSVAISGNSAVIGAPRDDDDGINSGSAYLFRRGSDGWVQSMKLPPQPLVVGPTAVGAGDRFGSSVAISSDYIIVGSPGDGDTTFEGAAHVFELCSRFCQEPATEMGELTASDGAAGDAFGFAVAIDGDHAIIGALESDDNGTSSGSVYVFRRAGDIWTEVDELTASDAAEFDIFGRSVAMSGDFAIVGAPGHNGVGNDSGAAYVFRLSGDTWTEVDKLTASDASLQGTFGWSVALSGDFAIVGAIGNSGAGTNSGAAYVFQRSGNDWIEIAKLTASDTAVKDFFGDTVAIDGDFALVGAFEGDGVGAGSAYVFRNRNGTWSEVNKLTASDAAAVDRFGAGVAISGDHAIVGANQNDDAGSASGSAYVFLK